MAADRWAGVLQKAVDDLRREGIAVDLLNRTETRVHGIPMTIVSAADAERADLVICGFPPAAYPDEDVLAWCADCQRAIVHRPHAPRAPVKVCIRCGIVRLQRGARRADGV